MAGDYLLDVGGSSNHVLRGDSAHTTGGFYKMGAAANAQMDAASWNFAAHQSQFNVAAVSDVNLVAGEKATLAGATQLLTISGANSLHSAKGTVGIAGGKIGMYSAADLSAQFATMAFAGTGKTSIRTTASAINVWPFVDYSQYTVVMAQAVGSVTPSDATTNYTFGQSTQHTTVQKGITDSQLGTTIYSFGPAHSGISNAGGGGTNPPNPAPYTGGISSTISGVTA